METICGYLNSGISGALSWTALLLFLGLIVWSIGRVATQYDLGTEFFARFRGIFTTIITTVVIIGYLIPLAGGFLEEAMGVEMPCEVSFGSSQLPWPEQPENSEQWVFDNRVPAAPLTPVLIQRNTSVSQLTNLHVHPDYPLHPRAADEWRRRRAYV
jgi:hypothetical protein